MKDWRLPGIILSIVLVVFLFGVVAANVKIDPVFVQSGASGSQAMNAAGLGQYATGQPTTLLSLIWDGFVTFIKNGLDTLFNNIFWG